MKGTRVRFGSILEWLVAAAVLAVVLAAGSNIYREFGAVRAVMPVIAGEARPYDSPAGLPPRAVSVPMLHLGSGREIRVGDGASDVSARFGEAVQVISESLERTAAGERVTRVYEDVGVQFILVFQPVGQNGEPQVAAIYLP